MRLNLEVFLFLQLLDALTTQLGFRLGAGEISPAIRLMMNLGPGAGLALSKLLAVLLGAVCVYTGRVRAIRVINYWYGAVVSWNLAVLLHALR